MFFFSVQFSYNIFLFCCCLEVLFFAVKLVVTSSKGVAGSGVPGLIVSTVSGCMGDTNS